MKKSLSPFSHAYWKCAANELKDTRVLVLAALIVAIRVAVRSMRIPIAENLHILIEFLPAALGSMVYGPIVALLSGAVSDVLGALLFPAGPFFPPFTLLSMLSSLLYALFLYKAPVTLLRSLLSKGSVNLLCNIILTPILLSWMMGRAAALTLEMPRIIKNITLLPIEAIALYALLRAMWPALRRYGFVSLPEGVDDSPGRVEAFLRKKASSLLALFGNKQTGDGDGG